MDGITELLAAIISQITGTYQWPEASNTRKLTVGTLVELFPSLACDPTNDENPEAAIFLAAHQES